MLYLALCTQLVWGAPAALFIFHSHLPMQKEKENKMLKFIFTRSWRRSVAWQGAISLTVWRNFCFQNQQNSERVCSRRRRYRWPASTSRQVVAVAATSHKYFANRSLSSFVFPASRFRPLWFCSLRFPFGKWYLRDFPRFRSIGLAVSPWFWVGEGDADGIYRQEYWISRFAIETDARFDFI